MTVTVAVIGVPEHPFAKGVMVYTTVPLVVALLAVSISLMADPVSAVPPLAPDCDTVQENVVGDTVLVRLIRLAKPVQSVEEAGVAVAAGVCFTVTTALPLMVFVQEPAVRVATTV